MEWVVVGVIVVSVWFVLFQNKQASAETDSTEDDAETVSTESPSTAVTTAPSRSSSTVTPAPYHGDTQSSSDEVLPGCFYKVAVLVGIGLGITTIAVIDNGGSAEEIGYMIGYTIGGVLSILATGRLIKLVSRISDDVRAIRERTDSQK